MPAANNMEAIWAVTLLLATCGKLYTRLSTKISVWMAYFMGLHVAKQPGVHFHQNYTLTSNSLSQRCCSCKHVLFVLSTSHCTLAQYWCWSTAVVIFNLCVTLEVLSSLLGSVIAHHTSSVWPKALPHRSRSRECLHPPSPLVHRWLMQTDGALTCSPHSPVRLGLCCLCLWKKQNLCLLHC